MALLERAHLLRLSREIKPCTYLLATYYLYRNPSEKLQLSSQCQNVKNFENRNQKYGMAQNQLT